MTEFNWQDKVQMLEDLRDIKDSLAAIAESMHTLSSRAEQEMEKAEPTDGR